MNHSHWIIFFVQRDILPQSFNDYFVLFTTIELFGDVLSMCIGVFGVYVFLKVHYFHFNLTAIWVNAFIVSLIFIVSRFLIIPFQFGYLQGTKAANEIIVNVSTFRFILWIALYHFEILIAIERTCALHFVATYEKTPRWYISAIIITSNYIISAILGYLIVHKIIHGFYYLACLFIASNISYLTFLYLNRAGKRQQKELLEKYRGYSVSYRWQIQHIIATAEQLSILMIVINVTVCIVLPSIFVPALILENDESMTEAYEVAKLILQLSLSLSFGLVYAIIILVIPKHREWLRGRKYSVGERYVTRVEKLTVEAQFSRLEDAWNAKLDGKQGNNNK